MGLKAEGERSRDDEERGKEEAARAHGSLKKVDKLKITQTNKVVYRLTHLMK